MITKVFCHLLMALVLLAAGCSGSGPAPEPAAPQAAAEIGTALSFGPTGTEALMPAPSEIERDASAVSDWERVRGGGDFYFGLPVANYSGSSFYPNWTGPADGMASAAFACYRFGFTDTYDDEARFLPIWGIPPSDFGNVYVGIANFATDRWDWQPCPAEGINLGDPTAYLAPSNAIYVCVLLLGTDPAYLSLVLLGSNTTPAGVLSLDLDLDPKLNIGPRTVAIDASNVYSVGGEILSWDFDFEGDGTYDVLADTDGQESHIYSPGDYNLKVRVTESSGKQGILEKQFTIVNPMNQPPLADLSASALAGSAPLTLSINGSLSTDADGTITKYEYDYDNDGEWDIVSDVPDPVEIVLSAYGSNIITLRVTDNDFATATDTLEVILDSGWVYSVVDNNAHVNDEIAMSVTGADAAARATVAYVNWNESELRYCNGANAAHNSWSAVRLPIGTDALGLFPGVSIAYNHIEDAPMISFTDYDGTLEDKLSFVLAKDTYGSQWNAVKRIDSNNSFSLATSIAMINNLPVVAGVSHFMEDGESEILYYQATSSTGTDWSAARVAMPKQAGAYYRDVSVSTYENGLFDRPIIAFTSEFSPPFTISNGVVRASNVDGTAWGAASYFTGGAGKYEIDINRINGKPAVAAGSISSGSACHYAQSFDEAGTSWPADLQAVSLGGSIDLDTWGGRPCIVSRENNSNIHFVRATDADGTSWEEPIPVDRRYLQSDICAMKVVNDQPVICYVDLNSNKLLAAAWKSN